MAATVSNVLSIICLLLVININFSTSGEYSGLLSRLYKRASQNNRPLILVLDNTSDGKRKEVAKKSYATSLESEDTIANPLSFLYRLLQSQKKSSPKRTSKAKHTHVHENKEHDRLKLRSHDRKQRLRSRNRNDKREETEGRENRLLRSPVLKSLLRMANGLNCEAKDECEDECSGKYGNGKKKDQCEDKCEQKFDCEEEKDECQSEDECAETTTDCNVEMSTQGEKLEPEENKCKRC